MDGAVFFAEAASGTFCLVWVSAICFLFDLEDGVSMYLCPYLVKNADYAFISKYRRDQSSSIPIKDGRHLTD